MLGTGLMAGWFVLGQRGETGLWWGGAIVVLAATAAVWRRLWKRYGVDGRLVLREMAGRRSRVSSTLLGLSVGIAGLSIVTLTTSAVGRILETQLNQNAEGNLLVVARRSDQREAVKEALSAAQGVESFSQFAAYRAVLLEINGELVSFGEEQSASEEQDPRENSNFEVPEDGAVVILSVRETLEDLPRYQMVSGRRLAPEDAGSHRIMIRESDITNELGIKTEDHLLFRFENGAGDRDDVLVRLTVVGIVERQSEQTGFGDQFLVPPDTLPGTVIPVNVLTVAMIDKSSDVYMDNVLIALSDIPGAIPIELSAITQLLENLLEQLKAIPTLVAWLALVAGTAIIANTVALATQERRRQIGVMKAVGLKGRRVLGMLMIENGLIGLMAGIIGVSVGLMITVILVLNGPRPDELKETIQITTIVEMVLMSIGVAIGAATLSAWSAAAEKPMNVLRYE
jgi:predicted lysophospholipase L1 biosynthesis ABC-type transport system permease subunit